MLVFPKCSKFPNNSHNIPIKFNPKLSNGFSKCPQHVPKSNIIRISCVLCDSYSLVKNTQSSLGGGAASLLIGPSLKKPQIDNLQFALSKHEFKSFFPLVAFIISTNKLRDEGVVRKIGHFQCYYITSLLK